MRILPARRRPYYYGWNILGIGVVAQIVILGLSFNCFSLFVPLWSKEMHAAPSTLVFGITLFSFMALIVNPISGWLSDRCPVNRQVAAGAVIAAIGYAVIAFAQSALVINVVFATLFAFAVGIGCNIPTQSAISRWFGRQRGLAMGINAGAMVIGGIILPPVMVLLLQLLGWRDLWLLTAVVNAVIIAPFALWTLYDRPEADDSFGYIGPADIPAAANQIGTAEILRRPNFWIIVALFITILATFFSITTNGASIILSYGFSLKTAGFVISLVNIFAVAGKLIFGAIADRLGNRVPLIVLALLAALGTLMLYSAGSKLMLLLAILPLGLCAGTWTVIPSALAAEFGSASFGKAYGLVSATMPVAMIVVPLVARVKEQTGSYGDAFLGLAAAGLVGAAIATMLRQPGLSSGKPRQLDVALKSVPSGSS